MYEELFIIDNGKRLRVDLSIPSGITLNFKSNIFGDLSKITCSYTYTFKLPLTANNRRVFDKADDVRCISNKIRRRLRAEYIQNGISLFGNANLYIESTDAYFNAVMTWGVIDGLQTMKDNDISIRELPFAAFPIFGPCNSKIEEYRNDADFVQPLYNAGMTYITENGFKNTGDTYSVFPLPAIPVYKLIKIINGAFGVKFKFGLPFKYGMSNIGKYKIINHGVIPCVSVDAPDNSKKEIAVLETMIGRGMVGNFEGIPYVLIGGVDDPNPIDDRFRLINETYGHTISVGFSDVGTSSFELDGCIRAKFTHETNQYNGQGRAEMGAPSSTGIIPKLVFYRKTNGNYAECIASVEGRFSYDDARCWIFDFSEERGKNRISISLPSDSIWFCAIEANANAMEMSWSELTKTIKFYENYASPDTIKWDYSENLAGNIKMNLMSNLPDISCLTLMKSLYFMLGAFPTINNNGDITPVFYSDLRENLIDGIVVDWSSKIIDSLELPSKTTYNINGFGQKNYYMMKNDNAENDETDLYANGKGAIYVNNEVIEKDKTIVQLPFYGPYIKNKKAPTLSTGNTMKFWYYDGDKVKTTEAKPCFGIIKPLLQVRSGIPTGIEWMSMEIWNDFKEIQSNPSYSYLSKIMGNPIIITLNLDLNEHDLRHLDYSVPVYLSKYGAYFAVVSITRDSKGISKCELIKLPEEE